MQTIDHTLITRRRHSIKVDKQTEKNLVCRWAIFMYSRKITHNRNRGHVVATKGKHTGRLRIEAVPALRGPDVLVEMLVLEVIGSGDLRQKPRNHLDDIRDRH